MSHSNIVGGSTAARVVQCPGSIKLSQAVKKDEGNEHTRRGTMLHECMEHWMEHNEYPAIGFRGSDPEAPALTKGLIDTKLRPAAQAYIDLEEGWNCEVQVMVERKIGLQEIDGAFGTMDVIAQSEGSLLAIVDWKFGDGVMVEAEHNKQLMFGACGVLDEIAGWEDYSQVELSIIQPSERRPHPLSTWVCSVDELADFYLNLQRAVDNGLGDEPSFETGDNCRFCPGTVSCPLMNSTFHEMDTVSTNNVMANIGVVELSDSQIADLLIQAEDVQLFIKALQNEAMDRIQDGIDFPEWKLVAKRVLRKWEDEAAAEAWFRLKKVRVCDMKKQVLKSPAQMDKVTDRDFKHLLHQGEPGVTLARSGDKRPALTFTLTKTLTEALNNE